MRGLTRMMLLVGVAKDCAGAAAFLSSSDAEYITGEVPCANIGSHCSAIVSRRFLWSLVVSTLDYDNYLVVHVYLQSN